MSPVVWLLLGARRGDNDQVELLARMLGVDTVAKPLAFKGLHVLPGWALGGTLASLTAETRKLIVPPWPKLVIAAGKRSAPVARFIKQASGGATKLVHIGRPRAPLAAFDLVITTPQYGLPAAPNVLELPLPFSVAKPVAESELADWRTRWAELPRPWTAVAIGAEKFPQRLGKEEARRLAAQVSKIPGSLIVMASPRTDGGVMSALRESLAGPVSLHGWGEGPNPYQAALALADGFVVTSDSMSMLSEAINTGKPVSIFRLPSLPLVPRWNGRSGLGAALASKGWLTPPRDMKAVVDRLIAEGFAVNLGEERPERSPFRPGYEAAITRVRSLFS